MSERISALVVHSQREPMSSLGHMVEQENVVVDHASTCGEAFVMLWGGRPPHLVFTDTTLPDGSWVHILALARQAPTPVNVIVVSSHVDIALYLETLDQGAFDFITPPFEAREIAYTLRCAVSDVRRRRKDKAELNRDERAAAATLELEYSTARGGAARPFPASR
jgi:DNA-binding NtrC family response regulator